MSARMHEIHVKYDPLTRMLELADDSRYGGSTIDSDSNRIWVEGIEMDDGPIDAWLEFAVDVITPQHTTFRPPGQLLYHDKGDHKGTWSYIIEQPVLAAGFRLKKLPFQLVIRYGSQVINSANQITLQVSRSINALGTMSEYYPRLMWYGGSWEWRGDVVYKKGSVVSRLADDGQGNLTEHVFISLTDCNSGNDPNDEVRGEEKYWYVIRGDKGDKGEKGDKGDTGYGAPTGGLTGQMLVKVSNEDYEYGWAYPEAVSGTAYDIPVTLSADGHTVIDNPLHNRELIWSLSEKVRITEGSREVDAHHYLLADIIVSMNKIHIYTECGEKDVVLHITGNSYHN